MGVRSASVILHLYIVVYVLQVSMVFGTAAQIFCCPCTEQACSLAAASEDRVSFQTWSGPSKQAMFCQ